MSPSLQEGHTIALPQRLDTAAYADIKNILLQAKGNNKTPIIDASDVTYIGGLCLELLLSSGLKISRCSEELINILYTFGVFELLVRDKVDHV